MMSMIKLTPDAIYLPITPLHYKNKLTIRV